MPGYQRGIPPSHGILSLLENKKKLGWVVFLWLFSFGCFPLVFKTALWWISFPADIVAKPCLYVRASWDELLLKPEHFFCLFSLSTSPWTTVQLVHYCLSCFSNTRIFSLLFMCLHHFHTQELCEFSASICVVKTVNRSHLSWTKQSLDMGAIPEQENPTAKNQELSRVLENISTAPTKGACGACWAVEAEIPALIIIIVIIFF